MDLLLVLLIEYFFFLIIAFVASNYDYISPSVLFFASFTIMFLMGYIFRWLFDYHIKWDTFFIITLAGILFFVAEHVSKLFRTFLRGRRGPFHADRSAAQPRPIVVKSWMQWAALLFMILSILLAVYLVVSRTGNAAWRGRMNEYIIGKRQKDIEMGFFDALMSQMNKIVKAIACIFAYIIIYNKINCRIPLRLQKCMMAVIALFVPATMLQGGRQATVELVVFIGVSYLLLMRTSKKRLHLLGILVRVLPLLVIFVFVFTATAATVGRADIERNPLQYVVTYLCGGLKNFDELIVGNPGSTKYFGQSTFSYIYSFLINRFHMFSPADDLSYHKVGFVGDTNITIFGRWYEDFGAPGVWIMTVLVSMFFTWLHDKAMEKRPPNFVQVIYAQQLMALIWASYDDRVYAMISVFNLLTVFIIYLTYRILIGGGRVHIVFGKKRKTVTSL